MKPVLLDTNVLTELVRLRPDPRVVAFVASTAHPLLSVLTLHELVYGAVRLRAASTSNGRPSDPVDALIAASAVVRGVGVATRNRRDFEPFGVEVVDPWAARSRT